MDKRIRVLFITGSFPPMLCGVGDYAHKLVIALTRHPGLHVAVLTSRSASALDSTANFEFFPIVEAWHWRELAKILRLIRCWAPDLVHIQYPTLGYSGKVLPFLLPICIRLAATPVVQTWHEIYEECSFRFLNYAPGGLILVRKHDYEHFGSQKRWAFLKRTVRYIPIASAIPAVTLTAHEREMLRAKYARPNFHLIVYFGFLYPTKGADLLFQIANAEDSHIVMIGGELREQDLRMIPRPSRSEWLLYPQRIRQLSESDMWKGKVTLTGFMAANEAARVIAAADAMVQPFIDGGGEGKSTIHAAQAQGTFLLTTSNQRRGYDIGRNTYFSRPNDVEDMRIALKQHLGKRAAPRDIPGHEWKSICEAHVEMYKTQVSTATVPRLS